MNNKRCGKFLLNLRTSDSTRPTVLCTWHLTGELMHEKYPNTRNVCHAMRQAHPERKLLVYERYLQVLGFLWLSWATSLTVCRNSADCAAQYKCMWEDSRCRRCLAGVNEYCTWNYTRGRACICIYRPVWYWAFTRWHLYGVVTLPVPWLPDCTGTLHIIIGPIDELRKLRKGGHSSI